MILPPFIATDPATLAVAVLSVATVQEARAAELALASCIVGEDVNVDPAWLCAVALGETPTLRPTVRDGVCQVVGDTASTISDSVRSAGTLYARIVRKHGRRNAHLFYGCGIDRCGGKWTRQAKHKVFLWRRIRRQLKEREV